MKTVGDVMTLAAQLEAKSRHTGRPEYRERAKTLYESIAGMQVSKSVAELVESVVRLSEKS